MSPPPSNYTEVCKNCNETYKKLNDMYNDMQKREQKHEGEEQAHLCIDVEDAVSISHSFLAVDPGSNILSCPV